MGHDIVFDIENKRIGWSESTCDYTELVDEYQEQFDTNNNNNNNNNNENHDTSSSSSPNNTGDNNNNNNNNNNYIPDTGTTSASIGVEEEIPGICSSRLCKGPLLALLLSLVVVGVLKWKNHRISMGQQYG